MKEILSARMRRRLDIQGFDTVDEQELAPVAPWMLLGEPRVVRQGDVHFSFLDTDELGAQRRHESLRVKASPIRERMLLIQLCGLFRP